MYSASDYKRAILLSRNLANRYDFSKLKDRYTLESLATSDRDFNAMDPGRTCALMRERLDKLEFDPQQDLIIVAGSTSLTSLLFAVVGYNHPKFAVLLFHAVTEEYLVRLIDLVEV